MEHSDGPANIHNVCHSPLCSAIDPPTSNVSLFGIFPNGTSWLDTYCCLPDVSVVRVLLIVMYQCQSPRRRVCCSVRHCGRIFVHFTVIISTVGLIFSLLWVYEQMLVAQVAETGITGIVLSLLPSLPLSALGWYVKRRYQRAVTNECSEEQQSTNVTIQSSDTEDEKPLASYFCNASFNCFDIIFVKKCVVIYY